MAPKDGEALRSEDDLGAKFDRCIADSILKFGGGLAIGIVASAILFKRKTWPVWFGAGCGIGSAYSNCQHDFQSPYLLRGKLVKATSGDKDSKGDYVMVVDPSKSAQKS